MRFMLAAVALLLLAGCVSDPPPAPAAVDADAPAATRLCDIPPRPLAEPLRRSSSSEPAEAGAYVALGFDGTTWPRLDGATLTILDHGAFGAFDDAKKAFEKLTGATVVRVGADDSGSALRRAELEKGAPTFDVLYGVDNVLWTRAIEAEIFRPYRPLLADRIDPAYVFFNGPVWHATPVDHGYIGVNVDEARLGAKVEDLDGLLRHAGEFVTQDPRTSTPGLGFLLATIASCGERWPDYWTALFEGGVLVTSGWTEAYEQHFSAGYGVDYGGAGDKAIVTSYTESPAYEAFYGRPVDLLATPLVAPGSTFHQIQTMGIVRGTPNLAAAEAWIEFALTDDFQALAAPGNAVYPVVRGLHTDATYGANDPEPGTFVPATLGADEIGGNLQEWLYAWVDLCEAHACA